MSKARRSVPPKPPARDLLAGWRWAALLALAVLFFYWVPLVSDTASIQWDAVDTHYSPQKYFADRIRNGELPFWTPYIFSGFPFLVDPQVAAWYPLHWPFFLTGITPRAVQAELVLHVFLAAAGTYLLLRRLLSSPAAALVGAFGYALSGYFAGNPSHVGTFVTPCALPWLLVCFDRAFREQAVRWTALAGGAGGLMILAGHFQTALYSFAALALFAIAEVIRKPRAWLRAAWGGREGIERGHRREPVALL